jgi:hypothetical protein
MISFDQNPQQVDNRGNIPIGHDNSPCWCNSYTHPVTQALVFGNSHNITYFHLICQLCHAYLQAAPHSTVLITYRIYIYNIKSRKAQDVFVSGHATLLSEFLLEFKTNIILTLNLGI